MKKIYANFGFFPELAESRSATLTTSIKCNEIFLRERMNWEYCTGTVLIRVVDPYWIRIQRLCGSGFSGKMHFLVI
jgi:hypothetical protein